MICRRPYWGCSEAASALHILRINVSKKVNFMMGICCGTLQASIARVHFFSQPQRGVSSYSEYL